MCEPEDDFPVATPEEREEVLAGARPLPAPIEDLTEEEARRFLDIIFNEL